MRLGLRMKTTAWFMFFFCSSLAEARTLAYPFNFKLFTSDVLGDEQTESAGPRRMQGGLQEILQQAQQHVLFSIYGVDKQTWLEDDLTALRNRQITLQAVVDQEQGNFGEWIATNFMYHDTAKLPAILGDGNVRPDQTDKGTIRKNSIMHNKFIVVDDRFTWTGSTNLSPSGIGGETHANISVLIDSPELAQMFAAEFLQMFGHHRFSLGKKKLPKENLVYSDGTILSAYFSPQDDAIAQAVLPFIERSQQTLDIGMFFLTERRVLNALANAVQRGVRVRLLYDGMAARHPYNYLTYLKNAGVELKVENWAGKMHLKTAISDRRHMIVGSMNWSKSGDHKNDENTLVIENNETIAGEFHSYFETLWNALPNNASNFNASSLFMESEASERELEMLEVD